MTVTLSGDRDEGVCLGRQCYAILRAVSALTGVTVEESGHGHHRLRQ
jgi:hypothetical protein